MIRLQKIFVGRKKELATLEEIWIDSLDTDHENKAYVIFNSPGVGKTTLVRKFGKILEEEERGIHFNFVCNKEYANRVALHKDILLDFIKLIKIKKNLILEFIDKNEKSEYINETKKELEYIFSQANILKYKNIVIGDLITLISILSNIIPIFFSSDEIQEFEGYEFTENDKEETVLHYYSNFIKSFLSNRILLVITGTQFHILRELGDKIGSPLRGKVNSEIISPLTNKDISDFIDKLKDLVPDNISDESIEYLHRYLQTFSGGHGRTIEKTTKEFLKYYESRYKKYDYYGFEDKITKYLKKILIGLEITDYKKKEIKKLQSRDNFELVRQWIHNGLTTNLRLGSPPEINSLTEEILLDNIVYKFMTIGIITQNGGGDYHITSYFHYLTFLELMIGEYEGFLTEIMNNKYFRRIVGGDSGFGYTFENIIMAILIINSNKVDNFTFKISRIERISVKIDYRKLDLKKGLMYYTPKAKNIDAIALIDDIEVFQITTSENVPKSKIDKFNEELDIIREETGKNVKGWFVSLFDLKFEVDIKNLNIIQGSDLVEFMNENIYNKLIEIKREL